MRERERETYLVSLDNDVVALILLLHVLLSHDDVHETLLIKLLLSDLSQSHLLFNLFLMSVSSV